MDLLQISSTYFVLPWKSWNNKQTKNILMFLLRNIEWYWSEGYKTCKIMGICIDTKKNDRRQIEFPNFTHLIDGNGKYFNFCFAENAFHLYDKRTNGSK